MLSIRAAGADPSTAIAVLLATPELRALNDSWYDRAAVEVVGPDNNAAEMFPVPDEIAAPKPEIGKLFYPVIGARQWARGDFLLVKDDLDTLRTALAGTTGVTLSFGDAVTDSEIAAEVRREFNMFLLAARPLVDNSASGPEPLSGVSDAWVVTLVDVRYYWQFSQAAEPTGTYAFSSWTNLFSKLGTQLGATITVEDAVDADYLTPTARWNNGATNGKSTAHLLDAAASFVGSRIVVYPDGTAGLQRPEVAHQTLVTAFHAANADRHLGGGLITADQIEDGIVANYQTVFSGSPPVVETTALPTGTGGNGWAWVDALSTLAGASRTALADQYGADFYSWQFVPLDAEYAGFTTVPVSGFVGHLEYHHHSDEGLTVVRRPPENYGAVLRGGNFSAATGDCCSSSADYYTATSPTHGEASTAVTITPTASNTLVTNVTVPPSIILVPAGSGRVWVAGDILMALDTGSGMFHAGETWLIRVLVALAEVDSSGAYVADVSSWKTAMRAGQTTAYTGVGYPTGIFGDYCEISVVGTGGTAGFDGHAATKVQVPNSGSDKYYAWQFGYVYTASNLVSRSRSLYASNVGSGGTWLETYPVCCARDPVAPVG